MEDDGKQFAAGCRHFHSGKCISRARPASKVARAPGVARVSGNGSATEQQQLPRGIERQARNAALSQRFFCATRLHAARCASVESHLPVHDHCGHAFAACQPLAVLRTCIAQERDPATGQETSQEPDCGLAVRRMATTCAMIVPKTTPRKTGISVASQCGPLPLRAASIAAI